jgi:2-isopropylmalate synthase
VLKGVGDGVISEFEDWLGIPVRVMDYHEHAIGTGTDTRAACYVEARIEEGATGFGVGIDRDIVTASFKAVLSGLNRHIKAK